MPLISCPDCGRDVSDRAPYCPGCGYPISEYVQRMADVRKERQARLAEKRRIMRYVRNSVIAVGIVIVFVVVLFLILLSQH
jgi:uncharacterized membrane protein YvbJ